MNKSTSKSEKKQASREMKTQCWKFLYPVLAELQKRLDRRLVKTLLDLVLVLVLVIMMHRHRNNGLLLSELGEYLMGSERGPAGVKRIASVLYSSRWQS